MVNTQRSERIQQILCRFRSSHSSICREALGISQDRCGIGRTVNIELPDSSVLVCLDCSLNQFIGQLCRGFPVFIFCTGNDHLWRKRLDDLLERFCRVCALPHLFQIFILKAVIGIHGKKHRILGFSKVPESIQPFLNPSAAVICHVADIKGNSFLQKGRNQSPEKPVLVSRIRSNHQDICFACLLPLLHISRKVSLSVYGNIRDLFIIFLSR